MTQPIENKEPRAVLIAHFSRKLAPRAATRTRQCRVSAVIPQWGNAGGHTYRSSPTDQLGIAGCARPISPPDIINRSRILRVCGTALRHPHQSRPWLARWAGAPESRGLKPRLRNSSGLSGSSSLLPLRPVGWTSLARAHSVAPSCRRQAHSGWISQSLSRRMPHGPFQTNLAGLGWSGSSRLISLLVVNLATSASSCCPCLLNEGPLRAGKTTCGLKCFLLRPTAFHYAWLQGSGGYARRGFTGESGLFFNDLRLEDFLLFFAAIAFLLCSPATQADSAIRRPNVSSRAKAPRYTGVWTYAKEKPRLGLVRSALSC